MQAFKWYLGIGVVALGGMILFGFCGVGSEGDWAKFWLFFSPTNILIAVGFFCVLKSLNKEDDAKNDADKPEVK